MSDAKTALVQAELSKVPSLVVELRLAAGAVTMSLSDAAGVFRLAVRACEAHGRTSGCRSFTEAVTVTLEDARRRVDGAFGLLVRAVQRDETIEASEEYEDP